MLQTIGDVPLFQFSNLPGEALVHAISTRLGGVSAAPFDTFNQSISVPDEPAHVAENRRRLANALGSEPDRLVTSRQVHGRSVLVVDGAYASAGPIEDADIQITNRPGWLLSLRFADCVPILLADSAGRAVAAVHAGWRGTQAGAAGTAVRAMVERFGVDPAGLRAGIGPSIGPCCYEVGEEVASLFGPQSGAVIRGRGPRPYLDLWALNRDSLVAAGVPDDNVETAEVCTRCRSELFFSHRVQGFPAGRFSAVIGLR